MSTRQRPPRLFRLVRGTPGTMAPRDVPEAAWLRRNGAHVVATMRGTLTCRGLLGMRQERVASDLVIPADAREGGPDDDL